VAHNLKNMRIAILATDGVERVELEQPRGAMYGAGAASDLLSIHRGEIQARQFDLVPAGTFPVDRLVSDASADQYDALLLPGGVVNPDKLRMNAGAVGFVKAFAATGKPVAVICHGPWTLIEAGAVGGHRLTSWPSLWTDLRNVGAEAVDQDVVVNGPFTTSRSPADLPASARRSRLLRQHPRDSLRPQPKTSRAGSFTRGRDDDTAVRGARRLASISPTQALRGR
jgi:protease I